MTNPNPIDQIKLEDVKSVYSGKDGHCCCGCSGNHRYASAHAARAGKERGYAIDAHEINDKQVRRVFHILKEHSADAEYSTFVGSAHASVVIGARLYIVYI